MLEVLPGLWHLEGIERPCGFPSHPDNFNSAHSIVTCSLTPSPEQALTFYDSVGTELPCGAPSAFVNIVLPVFSVVPKSKKLWKPSVFHNSFDLKWTDRRLLIVFIYLLKALFHCKNINTFYCGCWPWFCSRGYIHGPSQHPQTLYLKNTSGLYKVLDMWLWTCI